MLKLLSRYFFCVAILVFAFAAPSAQAARNSHAARSHAVHHGRAHARNIRHKRRHKTASLRKAASVHLVNAATLSTAVLVGENAVEAHADYLSAGEAEASRVVASTSGIAGLAHVYIDSRNTARVLVVGLYASNSAGQPSSLMSTGSISTVNAGAWNSVSLSASSLVSGKTYWLAVLGQQGTLRYRDRRFGPCPSVTSAQTNLGSMPASWRTGRAYFDCPVSAYVTAAEPVIDPPPPVEPPLPPPPPAAPTGMTIPTISGTPTQGQVLSSTNGTWTGSPSSYAHQWQDCDKAGANCSSVTGATGTSYALASSDTGHMMRVVVTASNEGGSSSATSAATKPVASAPLPPPSPTPPSAGFTFAPSSPVIGEAVTFDGSSSTCSNGPCTYAWSDDGSPTQPITPLWPLGTGQASSFTFLEAGTKFVRLTVTDASGQTATIEKNVAVEEAGAPPPPPPPPPPPAAPTSSSLPTVSGTTTEGQALSAAHGSWTGNPTSYAYQWQDCDGSGGGCVSIAGAKAAAYTLTAGDVGNTLRVVVTASNEGGSASATSAATATVEAIPPPPPPPAAPTNTSLPTVSGTTTEGQSLSAANGSWTGSPMAYAYKWQDCDTAGANCANIGGATSSIYMLGSSDVNHTLRVIVTATNEGGSTSATSAQTATVAAQSSGGGGEACTTTISSVSQVNSSLKAGAVVCLAAGTYGAVSITVSPSSNATLTAAPGAHVVVGGVNIAGSNLTVSQLHSTGTINVGSGGPYPGFSHDVIDHNEVGPTNGYGISVMSATSTPSSYITISNNKIHDTSATGEGDALRFDGWNHITVTGNDIYNIKECAGSGCHTDTLQSYNGGVATTGLTLTKNYTHNNVGAQGFPFLKDGDISNVLISDNLSVHNSNTNGQVTGVWVDENIAGLTITNNTYQSTSGSIVQPDGSAQGPTVAINHNVFDNINVRPGSGPSYATTEDYDIFTGDDEYTFKLGSHSLLKSNPGFMNTAMDDYRLASDPSHIGIDWSPAEQQYGPAN
jgi:hypothetical protein